MKHLSLSIALIVGSIGTLSQTLSAATLENQTYTGSFPGTISGTLADENTVLLEAFTFTIISDFTATSTSYFTGGFEPNLILFNPAGIAMADGQPFGAAGNTGLVGDSQLVAADLVPGAYTLAISDFEVNQSLIATNLSAGFTVNYGDGVDFIDADGNLRTGSYSVSVTDSAASTDMPEPASVWIAPFLAALVLAARKRLVKQTTLGND